MRPTSRRSLSAASINSLPAERRRAFLESLSADEVAILESDWRFWARPEQLAPAGAWRVWLFLGGRGAGKTRAGTEWVLEGVRTGRMGRVALVGATYADVRGVMVEGVSGMLRAGERDAIAFEPSKRMLSWASGAVAHLFSAEEPDGLRGYQFDGAACDEFCKWREPQATLDMLMMGLRLGQDPRAVVTTTPRNIPALKALMAMPGVVATHARTFANAANLAPGFLAQMETQYAGTRLGRQELDAELIEDNEFALWQRAWIERARVRDVPELVRVVVAVDPPAAERGDGDACGIVVAGRDREGAGYILADRSGRGLTPVGWAECVARAYDAFQADTIVAEANQGGAMVEAVIRQAAPFAAIRLVHAHRGKRVRATPAAALYERGLVHHAGRFPELEDQMCQYDGTGASPDRLDALVWALADLFPAVAEANPRVRKL